MGDRKLHLTSPFGDRLAIEARDPCHAGDAPSAELCGQQTDQQSAQAFVSECHDEIQLPVKPSYPASRMFATGIASANMAITLSVLLSHDVTSVNARLE